jgi:heme-degrading monooxygenase HmoA
MATLLVRHKVKNYANWKKGYDKFGGYRKKTGIKKAQVWRNSKKPNEVVIIHVWDSMDAAKAFATSKELKDAMKTVGVSDKPDVYLLEEVEETPF